MNRDGYREMIYLLDMIVIKSVIACLVISITLAVVGELIALAIGSPLMATGVLVVGVGSVTFSTTLGVYVSMFVLHPLK